LTSSDSQLDRNERAFFERRERCAFRGRGEHAVDETTVGCRGTIAELLTAVRHLR
jgi:hypothetical protein